MKNIPQLDTDLANQPIFTNYENQNQILDDPSNIELDEQIRKNMLINIDNEIEAFGETDGDDPQNFASDFLDQLKNVGPFSKQILNYSYPPLLYQRGDDDEGGAGEDDADEEMDFNEALAKGLIQQNDGENEYYYDQVDENGNVYLGKMQN